MRDLEEIFTRACSEGEDRIHKSGYATSISAFIGGIYVTFGGLLALTVVGIFQQVTGSQELAWFVGSMFYPVGFMFVVIGRSELFTENFLHPVLAVWEGFGQHKDLMKLWSFGFAFNMLGVVFITYFIKISGMLSEHHSLSDSMMRVFDTAVQVGLSESLRGLFLKAIFAGLLINFMSWLVVAADHYIAKVFMIWLTTFPIMLMGTHHAVVGSAEILIGLFHGAEGSFTRWFYRFLIPVSVGNHVGGVVFVAVLHYLQRFFHLQLDLYN